MSIADSINAFRRQMNTAVDRRAADTFADIIYVISIAATLPAMRWAIHTTAVISHVYAGNYSGSTISAKHILNAVARKELVKKDG